MTTLDEFDQAPAPGTATDGERPPIELTTEAESVRVLTEAINSGLLPDVYVTNGELVRLSQISGDVATANEQTSERAPLPVASLRLNTDGLAGMLASHTFTFKDKVTRDGSEHFQEEVMPAPRVLSAVLSSRYWPKVRPLHGIVGSPVLRPDGTLLQTPGYDQDTGLYLSSKVRLQRVPDRPSTEQVAEARTFLLDKFLGDFPWVEAADRANYIALLVTQILRPYVRSLSPFGLITATTQASGKTILSEGIGLLYGQRVQSWVHNENEQRKAITAVLDQPAATVVFDNIKEGSVIDSPTLAMLVTSPTWSDRLLGTNTTYTAPNDRLWLATGNNLHLGGDMATRTVMVRLDPGMPRPELRTQFTIPHLDAWVKNPAHRTTVLWHLLVLVMDWIAAGAKRGDHTMRQFTPWAAAVGGFLAHHGIEGFLANAEAVHALDDEDAEWTAFLTRWHDLYGSDWRTAKVIRASADVEFSSAGGGAIDRWEGDFLTDSKGGLPTAKSLGRYLAGQVGRFHGGYVLRSRQDPHRKVRQYQVEEYAE